MRGWSPQVEAIRKASPRKSGRSLVLTGEAPDERGSESPVFIGILTFGRSYLDTGTEKTAVFEGSLSEVARRLTVPEASLPDSLDT